jgi:zinc/manganese transport system permease protein
MSLMITPGAAAGRVTANPLLATVLSVVFAEIAVVGGIVLSLPTSVPVSPFVTAISFVIYLACRGIGALRSDTLGRTRNAATPVVEPT